MRLYRFSPCRDRFDDTMSTSLSRQLQQLRTASVLPPAPDAAAVAASSAPSLCSPPLHTVLPPDQLALLAKDAWDTLVASVPSLKAYRGRVFPDDDVDVEMDNEGDGDSDDKEEAAWFSLVLSLSSVALTEPCQIVLEYLLFHEDHKHSRLASKYSEWLVFSFLPHHEFAVFHRLVAAMIHLQRGIPPTSERYPHWLAQFRQSCHPCTTVALAKHVAADKGFFKLICDAFERYGALFNS